MFFHYYLYSVLYEQIFDKQISSHNKGGGVSGWGNGSDDNRVQSSQLLDSWKEASDLASPATLPLSDDYYIYTISMHIVIR